MKSISRSLGSIQGPPSIRQNVRSISTTPSVAYRGSHIAQRQHRSEFWIPQATLSQQNDGIVDAGQLLIRAGYFRQAYSGIFHMLPLGLRVQTKIEALVDKHMQSLGASKVSLSSISSQKLWERSGRLQKGSEFFKFKDRKDAEWLLAPTHEEEITTLVKDVVHAPGHLPVRVYQISRKYRDEKRPRGGLLRGREFIMKDLYTFDKSEADAHTTYAAVRKAYSNLFDELKLPYIEARADSGNMGGNLSHEFHFPSNLGEDDIITCSNCDYAKNEEFVPTFSTTTTEISPHSNSVKTSRSASQKMVSEKFISKDRKSLVIAYVNSSRSGQGTVEVNPFTVKKCLESYTDVDTGVENVDVLFQSHLDTDEKLNVYYLFDQAADGDDIQMQTQKDAEWLQKHNLRAFVIRIHDDKMLQSHLLKRKNGDACPECAAEGKDGILRVTKAIEVGHTFHLGDRYSSRLDFTVPGAGQRDPDNRGANVSMGCHGIGISRLIAAVASALSDQTGLIWPRAVAPFEVLIVVNRKHKEFSETIEIGYQIYDDLSKQTDVLIDDREDVDFGWKLKDADLIGYPIVVVLGKGWLKKKLVEIQCRRFNLKEEVPLSDASHRVQELLLRL